MNSNNDSILIFEPFKFHYECTPGFSKYFTDLGYNVDIIMNKIGITSFCYFEPIEKIRLFIYEEIEKLENNTNYFSPIFNKYKYILIETTQPNKYNLYKNLNLLNINKSLFVFHHIDFVNSSYFKNKIKKHQILSLGHFSLGTQINPHYFGDLRLKNKNRNTTFFLTSTINRNYKFLITAFETIQTENLSFHVNVVGKSHVFSKNDLSKKLINYFTFEYMISYSELYKKIDNSDFIIINFDPKNIEDIRFNKIRVTGSSQLVYGFLKPAIIHKDFAKFYNFNYSNSIIYDNKNFTQSIRNAIIMDNKRYKSIQENLSSLERQIYMESFDNLKKSLKIL